jgi:hypothetical protein
MANKCRFRKKNGNRCEANAQPANGLCVFHDPARAADGRRARQSGGIHRSRAAAVLPSDTPDHPLGNTKEVSAFLADSVNRLSRGQLDPRVANSMAYLTSVLLRALEQGSNGGTVGQARGYTRPCAEPTTRQLLRDAIKQ